MRMFVVMYRWRLKPGLEEQFIEGWSEITDYYVKNFDSLGSRLHRGDDGIWYAYAQWSSAEHRERAFQNAPEFPAREGMQKAIEERFDEVRLEIAADYLR